MHQKIVGQSFVLNANVEVPERWEWTEQEEHCGQQRLDDFSSFDIYNVLSLVHCCFYFISPYGHGLKPLDIDFMKQLSNKVSIVPVIAKSDCLTMTEIKKLKKRILEEIKENGIRIYNLPDVDSDEDEEYKVQVAQLRESIPFAVCGANAMVEVAGKKVRNDLLQKIWSKQEIDCLT